MKVYCSECGKANNSENIYCKSCNATLKTEKIEYGNKINSFEELITQENYKILSETYFTPNAYNAILEEIIRIGYDKFTYNENKSTLENVYDIVDEYVNIFSKTVSLPAPSVTTRRRLCLPRGTPSPFRSQARRALFAVYLNRTKRPSM